MKPCLIPECDSPAGVPGTARGWCSAHYSRWQRTGDPLRTLTSLKPPAPETCAVEGCYRKRWARGWCETHYQRWRKDGAPGSAELQWKRRVGRCSVTGCRRQDRTGGLCSPHYQRRRRHGDPLAGATPVGLHEVCSARSCSRPHYARGLCHAHWAVIGHTAERERRRGISIPGACTPAQLIARIDYYGNRCWMCGGPADQTDHVKPLSAGGSNWPANLRPACIKCNAAKSARWPFDTSTVTRALGATA